MLRTVNRIGKDTTLCMSLAARPGNFGTRFHNHLYAALGLDYLYKAFTTRDLPGAIGGIRALGIRGCAVSMPFKEACIPLLDALAPSAAAIMSVNTIVNTDGHLVGHNTDYAAVAELLQRHGVAPETRFAARGSGGMAKAVVSALRDSGFRQGTVIARNAEAGRALAEGCGYGWRAGPEGASGEPAEMLVNITPIGMQGGPEAEGLAFPGEAIAAARIVFDVVALPPETPLIRAARAAGKAVITGAEVIVLQALRQFVLYTGVTPEAEQVAAAAAYARAG
ncbi:shikimate 5-dehydrogenase [Roseomonas sp. KE0001]|uniref:shikimate 5-dehydrogenase n=1 Tax=Roseomonas sp. KE0001 TaxID=2479201 RepID=UPI0018DF4DB0|nr:shikimate 5-dehydrogenase [Roseomonas sp. KE0001]MBI0435396.1 shikimate 5-dehydrogenase [Roseomonas sp. KE0001]